MFLCGLRQKETLQVFHDMLSDKGKVEPFSTENWVIIEQLTEFLKVFKEATTLLSGIYYPTSHLVLNQLFLMTEKINEFQWKGGLYEKMVEPMKKKLKKYFEEIPPTFACAAALNPCLNIIGVELFIEKISFNLELHDEDIMHASKANNEFYKNFKELFQYYFVKHGNTNVGSTSSSSSYFTYQSSNPMTNFLNQLRSENTKRARGDGEGSMSGEFGRYTQTDFLATMGSDEFASFDILAWWKARESQFPILSIMARDLLSVQASTVASESAFSLSGRVLTIRRTRLTPASLEMCICLKDHLDAAERIQDKTSIEGELDIEQELHDVEVEEGRVISLSDEEIALDEASREASSEDEDLIS
jgi:hypothetical protein